MTTTNLNIAHLIEKNSMTRLSKDYENRFLTKIKDNFNENQQQLFVASFYCYLNYDKKKDFVIDFDNVWKWLGFTRKDNGKTVLRKHFTVEIDYQIIKAIDDEEVLLLRPQEQKNDAEIEGAKHDDARGGSNKETIMLTVNTFKKFCLKAGTKKADEVHDYYIKLEELLQETVNEESNELRKQLGNEKEEKKKVEDKLNRIVKASTQRKQLSKGQAIYVGRNELDTVAFKVGITSRPGSRQGGLSGGTTSDFVMKHIWYTRFNKQIEDIVKINYESHRILQRKEFYNISEYDSIVKYIDNLVKVLNATDPNPQIITEPTRKKLIKNPLQLPEKPCTVCNVTKSLEEFHFAKEHTDGRENRCKVCATRLQEEHIKNKRETEAVPQEKECTQCHEVFSLTNFYVDAQKFDGRGTKCKDCFKEIQKKDKPKIDVTEYCCTACKVTKPLDEFHKFSRSKTGHHFKCKECILSKAKEIYYRKKEGDAVVTN
jgi:hypothetical protein